MSREVIGLLFGNEIVLDSIDYTKFTTSDYTARITAQRREMCLLVQEFAGKYLNKRQSDAPIDVDADKYYNKLNTVLQALDDHIRSLYPLIQAELNMESHNEEERNALAEVPSFSIESSVGQVFASSNQAYVERHFLIFLMFRIAFASLILDFNPEVLSLVVSLLGYLRKTVRKLSCPEAGVVEASPLYLQAMQNVVLSIGYLKVAQKAITLLGASRPIGNLTFSEVSGLLCSAASEMNEAVKGFRKVWMKENLIEKDVFRFAKKMLAALNIGSTYYLFLTTKDESAQKSMRNHIICEISDQLKNFNCICLENAITRWIMGQCPFIYEAGPFLNKGKHGSFNKPRPCGKIQERDWFPGECEVEIFSPIKPDEQDIKPTEDDDQYWMFVED